MSEIDAGLRNERLTFETHLELLKEETALELEVNMEDRRKNSSNARKKKLLLNLSDNSTSVKKLCATRH